MGVIGGSLIGSLLKYHKGKIKRRREESSGEEGGR